MLISDSSIRSYILIIFKNKSLPLFFSVVKKFIKRRQRRIKYEWTEALNRINSIEVTELIKEVNSNITNILQISSCKENYKLEGQINFSSINYDLKNDEIIWGNNFGDNESNMYLHRFGWVFHVLPKSNRVPWAHVMSWIDWHNNKNNKNQLQYDSYTISERISNLAILLMLDKPSNIDITKIVKIIIDDAIYLSNNLEYYDYEYTNNHILNNSRALIISGSLLNNEPIYSLGIEILKDQIDLHVSDDGVLREGSSHYQFIVTRWMIEILIILKNKNDSYYNKHRLKVDKMAFICESIHSFGDSHFPLIGDVSPDFPPNWLFGISNSYKEILSRNIDDSYIYYTYDNWASLFGIDPLETIQKPLDKSWISTNNEWAVLKSNPWKVLCHSDVRNDDLRVNHGHADEFSFDLSYNGMPLIVDPGRKNYHAYLNLEEASINEKYHNSILVNSKGFGFLPRSFMNKNLVYQNFSRSSLKINNNQIISFLDNPKNSKNILNISRTIYPVKDIFKVCTNVKLTKKSRITMFLNIYSNSIKYISKNRIEFLGKNRSIFYISFSGINLKRSNNSKYYKSYNIEENICRVEWESERTLNFESIFEIGSIN